MRISFSLFKVLSLVCLSSISISIATAQQVGWKNNYQAISGSSYTLCYGTAATDDNSVFAVGQFNNVVDFGGDTLSESLSDQDGFLLKLDSAGNTIWAEKIATGDRGSSGFRVEARNNELYLVNQDNSQANGPVILVEKRDTSGTVLWTRSLSGYVIVDAFVSTTGEVYVLHTVADAFFVTKYSPAGTLQFTWTISNNFIVDGKTIAADNAGDVYVAFDSTSSSSTRDILVRKYSSAGGNNFTTVYAQKFGGSANIIDPKSLAVDDNNNLYISGTLVGSIVANSVTITNGLSSSAPVGFLLKLDNGGTGVWGVSTSFTFEPRISAFTGFTGIMLQFSRDKSKLFQLYGPMIYSRSPASGAVNDSLAIEHNYFDVTEAPDGSLYIAGKSLDRTNQDTAYVAKLNGFVVNCSNVSLVIDTSVCFGESFLGYDTTGIYRDTFALASGCDSVRTLILTVRAADINTLSSTICQGETFLGYSSTGIFNDTLTNRFGCDSIRVLTLTVLDTFYTSISQSICNGDTFMGYTASGIYFDTLQAANGCDSIIELNLSVLNSITTNITASICDGDTYEGYSSTGTYVDTFQANAGCDSIRSLALTVNTVQLLTRDTTLCSGESLNIGGTIQSMSGTYYDTLLSTAGCDSVIIATDLNFYSAVNAPVITQNGNTLSVADSFNSYQWYFNGNIVPDTLSNSLTIEANGNYAVVVTDQNNCSISSDTLEAVFVGVTQISSELNWTIYPNPTTGMFILDIPLLNAQATLQVMDIQGAIVMDKELEHGGSIKLDIGDLSPGTYLILLRTANYRTVQKIVLAP